MDKRREGKPGEARAALRRSVRDNGYLFICYYWDLFVLSMYKISTRQETSSGGYV